MRTPSLPVVLVVGLLGCFHSVPARAATATSAKTACNLRGLSAVEREESQGLRRELEQAVTATTELPDGYAFNLDISKLTPTRLFRWVDLERRCCPFFAFGIDLSGNSTSAVLRMTGNAEAKNLIRAALPTR